MTEVPKIVSDRLHAASERLAARGEHPDADLLTAFGEQALAISERENILAHLALCGNCREVIALALPAEDVAPEPTAVGSENRPAAATVRAEKGWFTSSRFVWPGLRWAAVAAGVAVAASVLLMHPGKLNPPTQLSEKQDTQNMAPPASVAQNQPSPMHQTTVLARPAETAVPQSSQLSRRRPLHMQSHEVQSAMLLANNKSQSNDNSDALAGQATKAKTTGSPAVANETVEVSSANPLVEITEEPSHDLPLTSRDMAPAIEKAKPAPQSVAGAATAQPETGQTGQMIVSAQMQAPAMNRNPMALRQSLTPNVTWAISAGVLQQSKDNGQSWQTALHADHPLLTYASHGADVWVGGEAGTLYHSIDSGATWAQVQPSTDSQRLSSGITHIGISGPTAIVFSTTNNEVWSTMDGGKTWAKKLR